MYTFTVPANLTISECFASGCDACPVFWLSFEERSVLSSECVLSFAPKNGSSMASDDSSF
jgi:hypothetical protein